MYNVWFTSLLNMSIYNSTISELEYSSITIASIEGGQLAWAHTQNRTIFKMLGFHRSGHIIIHVATCIAQCMVPTQCEQSIVKNVVLTGLASGCSKTDDWSSFHHHLQPLTPVGRQHPGPYLHTDKCTCTCTVCALYLHAFKASGPRTKSHQCLW